MCIRDRYMGLNRIKEKMKKAPVNEKKDSTKDSTNDFVNKSSRDPGERKPHVTFILGEPSSFKTTFALHFAYNKIDAEFQLRSQDNLYALMICNQRKLERNTFYFGKYSSVYIGHLKKIKLRYLVNFNELAKFVTYFNSLKNPPLILIIDDLLEFLNEQA
eukprot:TRINITY_DN2558_c0_g1_i10.p1 TRINITY_DN2558_c0_g1~~TRINITY_DN2558_c0_g1_i10.p1  ORF type:complete len:180 (-),score=35.45 TRINITY_DN2558_c0_g1_i10:541-1020(-)